ncbi:MAG: sel1 repeat family protein [Deltaproteobacteria bacterium]|nr:sel1 repeat family protein [Deltaproteobacteria bacterium]
MAQHAARLATTLAALVLPLLGCGPGPVEIRATQTCEGGNVSDCKNRCGNNEGMPCYKLGWLHERGREVEPSFEQAMKLYQQSCDANWAQACRALGNLYWRGERVALNRKKALEYWQRACGLGLELACPTDLERDIADGKVIAVTRPGGALSVSPTPGYQGTTPTSVPSRPSTPSAPDPGVSKPSVPSAPVP